VIYLVKIKLLLQKQEDKANFLLDQQLPFCYFFGVIDKNDDVLETIIPSGQK
jgi:hypothetical protein